MNAKEELRMYRVYRARLVNLLSERELVVLDEALPGGFDYSADRCQTSPADQMPDRVIRIMKRCDEIDKSIQILENEMQRIKDSINRMKDHDSMRLLWLRYIEGKQWEDVAKVMNISDAHARGYMHGLALRKWAEVNTH